MAENTGKRLDRIEEKLDKMGEVLVSLARFEEKMDNYNDYRGQNVACKRFNYSLLGNSIINLHYCLSLVIDI